MRGCLAKAEASAAKRQIHELLVHKPEPVALAQIQEPLAINEFLDRRPLLELGLLLDLGVDPEQFFFNEL